jgi:hypothetical protein
VGEAALFLAKDVLGAAHPARRFDTSHRARYLGEPAPKRQPGGGG